MLTDKQIKQHEIKLSSSDILSAYERSQKPVKIFPWRKFLYVAVPATVALAVAVPLIFKAVNSRPTSVPIADLIDTEEGSRISNALVSSLYLMDFKQGSNIGVRMKNTEVTKSAFEKIVDTYEYADNLVTHQLNSSPETYQKVEDFVYKGKYDTYKYLITLDGQETIRFYLNYAKENQDVEFKGEVNYDSSTYLVEGKNKTEGSETEYEYKVYLDSANYMTVEEEKETGEYSYEYSVVKNGTELYTLTYSKEEEVELTFLTSDNEYIFQIDYSSSDWAIAYEDNNYEGEMVLVRSGSQKIYTDSATKIKIVK